MAIQYGHYQTIFSFIRSHAPVHRHYTMHDFNVLANEDIERIKRETPLFNPHRAAVLLRLKTLQARLAAETSWMMAGSPYYRVHPQMLAKLITTNLSRIPSKMLEMPDNTEVCCLYFPIGAPSVAFTGDSHDQIQSLLARKHDDRIDFFTFATGTQIARRNTPPTMPANTAMYNSISCTSGVSLACDDTSVQDHLNEVMTQLRMISGGGMGIHSLDEPAYRNALAVFISIGFLRNNTPELFDYDLLSKYVHEYKTASVGRRQELEEHSRRAGKNGWNCGTDEMFVEQPWDAQSHPQCCAGRELQWSHIRAGHPHAVRCGVGRKQVKIKWFRPVRVRADLPFAPDV